MKLAAYLLPLAALLAAACDGASPTTAHAS